MGHARKKSPAQLDREIAEALSQGPLTTEQVERYRTGRAWGWPADLAFKAATDRPLSRSPGHKGHAQKRVPSLKDIAPGLRNVAQRSVNAENRFIDYAMEHGPSRGPPCDRCPERLRGLYLGNGARTRGQPPGQQASPPAHERG